MHVLHFREVENHIPHLVKHCNLVTAVMAHLHLDRNPLVVREEERCRLRFVIVLRSEEVESCKRVLLEEEHKHTFEVDQIAVVLSNTDIISEAGLF